MDATTLKTPVFQPPPGPRQPAADAPERPGRGEPRVPVRRRWRRKHTVRGAAAAAAVALLALWLRPTPVEVAVAEVTRGPLETTVDADGVTRVRDRYRIVAPVSGRVDRITLREGDAVEAGMVIARIHPAALDPRTADQARARVGAAEAGIREAAARAAQAARAAEQAERAADRTRTLAAAGAVSDEALEVAQMERVLAVREHQAAQSREAAARAELQAARAGLLDADPQQPGRAVTEVRAPAAGRVLHVAERSEHIAAAGTPLVEVGDAAGLEVVVDVLSTDAVAIAPGAPVRLVEWGGEGALEARVVRVEPSAFTRVSALGVEEQRVLVVAALADAPPGLGDGYRVEARIVTWAAGDVVRVPTSALFRDGVVWGVFVVEDGRARRRVVEIGRRSAGDAQVVRGLAPGDRVILFPSDRIADGTRVR